MNRTRRGITLIEMLIGSFIMTVLGAGIWTLIRSSYDSQYMLMAQNQAHTSNRTSLDQVIDEIRGASALVSATADDISFLNDAGITVRYWRSGNTLRRSTGGTTSVGTRVVDNLVAFALMYWSYTSGVWSSSSAPGILTNVGGFDLTATVSVNGYSRQVRGGVRFRRNRSGLQ